MLRAMKCISILTAIAPVVLLAAGCASLPPGAEPGPDGTMAYDVLIDASAPGARIVANGQAIGHTPVHLKIFGDTDGTFHNFGSYYYVIRAFPLTTNQFEQSRVFRTGGILLPQDRIPSQIYFDMNRPEPIRAPATPPGYMYPDYGPPFYYGPPYYYGPPVYFGSPFYGPDIDFYFGPRFHRHGPRHEDRR